MKKLIIFFLAVICVLHTNVIFSQQVQKEIIIERGRGLALNNNPVLVPGDPLYYETAGYAKIMCSAVFITGLSPVFAAEHVGYFTSPYADRAKVSFPIIDYEHKKVSITLPNGIVRTAMYTGDQGCVCLPEGITSLNFNPVKLKPNLPDAATTNWPMGDVLINKVDLTKIDQSKVHRAVDSAFSPSDAYTAAFVVTYKGQIIGEKYGEGINMHTSLDSWSMGKSFVSYTHLTLPTKRIV